MKKIKLIVSTILMGVLLFALASCGGANGTLSSFVGAVKKADFEKASTYVVGNPSLKNPTEGDGGEMYKYIFEKSAKSFSYKVEEESMNSEETACTLKISYSGYSGTAITVKYAAKILTGSEASKATVDAIVKEMDKKSGSMSVVLVQDDEGNWEMEAVSASALVLAIYG